MPLRVLVVEDETLVAILLEDMLADLGHEVAAIASRLEPAIRLASSVDCDVAVLDVNLGGSARSFPVADRLRERNVPFVFATGYGRAGLNGHAYGVPVLEKPFRPQDLAKALKVAVVGS